MLNGLLNRKESRKKFEEKYYTASQWRLMWIKFKKHRLAMVGAAILIFLYTVAIFAEFFSPYTANNRSMEYVNAPPQRIRFFGEEGFEIRPFIYKYEQSYDDRTWRQVYAENRDVPVPISFFVRGDSYKLLGLFRTDVHLFGVENGRLYLFGGDEIGRDLFSRVLTAARVSLSVGLVGVALSFFIGVFLGSLSGFFGGTIDLVIQRIIEYLISIPTIPLWMALSVALPQHWSSIKIFFGITILLSLVGWCGVARVVRGKLLELREEEYALAARLAGSGSMRVIFRHLLPSSYSYLIVHLTLAIPGMIIGETALSFLGLGIRPPAVSWGTLLQAAQNVRSVSLHPWTLLPALAVIVAVLAFNFVGDGLRDAADPYK